DVADEGAVVLGAMDELRPDDEVRLAALEDVDGAPMEVDVAQVDLVADDELPSGEQDPLLEGLAVIRLTQADDLHLALAAPVSGGELLADLDGPVLRPVFGEDDLVRPAERLQPLAQIHDRGVEDRL